MAELRLSVLAGQDLDAIRETGESAFGETTTRRHLAGWERIFSLLREHPHSGQERPEFGNGIRAFSYHPHRLRYRIDREVVTILRIIHAAQDTSRIVVQ